MKIASKTKNWSAAMPPLVERLDGEGFATRVERGREPDWIVYFGREVV